MALNQTPPCRHTTPPSTAAFTSAMDPSKPTPMLKLPPELLEGVATFCDHRDLKSFRLACRELHNAADRTFVAAFFTHRAHLVTKYSLKTLVAITSSPRLRGQLQSVFFTRESLPYDPGRQQKVSRHNNFVTHGDSDASESEPSLSFAFHKRWRQMDEELHGRNKLALNLMVTVLGNLKSAGLHPALGAANLLNDKSPPFGHRQLAKMIGLVTCDRTLHTQSVWFPGPVEEGELLLTAIATSSFPVTDLRLPGEYCPDNFMYILNDTPLNLGLREAFKTLVSVELNVIHTAFWDHDIFDAFQDLVESCSALQQLSLKNSFGFHFKRTVHRLAKCFSSRGLKSFKLAKGYCSSQDLYLLLEPHRKTLGVIWISDLNIDEESEGTLRWGEIFKKLAASFALREVRFKELTKIDAIMCEDVAIKGTEEEVRAALVNSANDSLFERDEESDED